MTHHKPREQESHVSQQTERTDPTPFKFTATIEETQEGEAVITFPDDLMASLGWKPGDTLEWKPLADGSFSIAKKG